MKYILIPLSILVLACGQTTLGTIANNPRPTPTVQNLSQNATERPENTPETAKRVFIVSADILTVREAPSTEAVALGYVFKGQSLIDAGDMVAGVGDCLQWAKVIWEGQIAWVCAAFIYPE
jgi:hypothetical protein